MIVLHCKEDCQEESFIMSMLLFNICSKERCLVGMDPNQLRMRLGQQRIYFVYNLTWYSINDRHNNCRLYLCI